MRLLRSALLTGVLVALSLTSAHAQQAAPSPSHLAAAEELLVVMHYDSTTTATRDALLSGGMAAGMPGVEQMQKVMRDFMDKYLPWNELKAEVTQAYAAEFSEAELRELIAFYRTPVGQKWALGMPKLGARVMMITQQRLQAHMPELQQLLMSQIRNQ